MKCLRIEEWGGGLQSVETTVPEVGVNDVLVDVEATGIGRTVYNVMQGNMTDNSDLLPRIPGHEIVGVVAELGDGVKHLEVGDPVTTYYHLVCDRCRRCQAGLNPLCENHEGRVSVDIDGGYAEFVGLPARNVIELPKGIDPVEATAIPDAIATPYHVANQPASIEAGDDVMILGAGGGVGVHMLQMAQYFGARVTAVDIVGWKLDACRDLGAQWTINSKSDDLVEKVTEFGLEYDAVIDLTGDTHLLERAMIALGPRGRLVNLTTFPGNRMTVSPRKCVIGELAVIGSLYCAKFELMEAADLVANGDIEPVISETVELDGVDDLLDRIMDNQILGRGAVILT